MFYIFNLNIELKIFINCYYIERLVGMFMKLFYDRVYVCFLDMILEKILKY